MLGAQFSVGRFRVSNETTTRVMPRTPKLAIGQSTTTEVAVESTSTRCVVHLAAGTGSGRRCAFHTAEKYPGPGESGAG
jgi:hypothetical protein